MEINVCSAFFVRKARDVVNIENSSPEQLTTSVTSFDQAEQALPHLATQSSWPL